MLSDGLTLRGGATRDDMVIVVGDDASSPDGASRDRTGRRTVRERGSAPCVALSSVEVEFDMSRSGGNEPTR